ncbi:hypothetical protein DFH08DRAFT_896426 [Mycena albidolilacea]|uniref:DUF7330 domain-containing protein n=1 Tax=Mycena albidolilacea TaxID=1033008 RepID=A0AAD7EDW7_9AGAR|nr:hypothetical protein DFH08DRAFT_896426 [Mycena albidolilacea]
MILLESDLKNVQDRDIIANVALPDPPPAYSDSATLLASVSGPQHTTRTGPRPTNFLKLIRSNGPIHGSYTIDPRVKIPAALLPEAAEPRRNMHLETGGFPIDVDIFVVGDATSDIDIQLTTMHGPITARIHAASDDRPRIHITAHSDGPVTIALPHRFCGPITIHTFRCTPRLPADFTLFTENQDTRRGFIGDFSDWNEASVGDTLNLTSGRRNVTVLSAGEAGDVPQASDPSSSGMRRPDLTVNVDGSLPGREHHSLRRHHRILSPGPQALHPLAPSASFRGRGRGHRLPQGLMVPPEPSQPPPFPRFPWSAPGAATCRTHGCRPEQIAAIQTWHQMTFGSRMNGETNPAREQSNGGASLAAVERVPLDDASSSTFRPGHPLAPSASFQPGLHVPQRPVVPPKSSQSPPFPGYPWPVPAAASGTNQDTDSASEQSKGAASEWDPAEPAALDADDGLSSVFRPGPLRRQFRIVS